MRALISEQLHAIGATHLRDTRSGSGLDDKQVCFFSAAGRVIAITYSG